MPVLWNSLDGPHLPVLPDESYDNLREVFAHGGDGALWRRIEHGSVWRPWESLGRPGQVSSVSEVAVCTHLGGQLTLFVTGQDGLLYMQNKAVGGPAQAWESLDAPPIAELGQIRSKYWHLLDTPAVEIHADGRMQVFARTQQALWYSSQAHVGDLHHWTAWTEIVVPVRWLAASPVVGRLRDHSLALFVRTMHGELLWASERDHWQRWTRIVASGALESPVVFRKRFDTVPLNLFQRVDTELVHFLETGNGDVSAPTRFTAVATLGRPDTYLLVGRPAVCSGLRGLEVFVATDGGALWHKTSHSEAPTDWAESWVSVGNPARRGVNNPTAASHFAASEPPTDVRLATYVGATDGMLWRRVQKTSGEDLWFDWVSLGRPPVLRSIGRPAVGRTPAGDPHVFVLKDGGELWWAVRQLTGDRLWSGWSRWVSLGKPPGIEIDPARHVAAATDGAGRINAFAWTSDGALWFRTAADTAASRWGPWQSLSWPHAGTQAGEPSILLDESGQLVVHVLGGDGIIQRRVVDTALAWEAAEGDLFPPVGPSNSNDSWLTSFTGGVSVGLNHGGSLLPEVPYFFSCVVRMVDNGDWEFTVWARWLGTWRQVGSQVRQRSYVGIDFPIAPSNVLVAENSDGRLELFLSIATDTVQGHIWHIAQRRAEEPAPWIPGDLYLPTGPVIANVLKAGDPAVGLSFDNRLTLVMAVAEPAALYMRFQSTPDLPADQAANWSAWARLPDLVTPDVKWSAPALGKNRENHLEVFVLGSDGSVYHRLAENA